jgi:Protein of unknown function (DUF1018).
MNITKEHIRRLYALGAKNGMLESGNKDDLFHTFVFGLTKKKSVSKLTEQEFIKVENALVKTSRGNYTPKPKKPKRESQPGMVTTQVQRKAWALIYELEKFDVTPSIATPGQRMAGAIKKILGIDVELKDPFRWISVKDGYKLVERLKNFVESAKAKKERMEIAG